MGDFMPGYVSTVNNSRFKILEDKIIIIGQDNGFIYGKYKTKESLLSIVNKRRNISMTMMCYYKSPIVFSQYEMEVLWKYNIYPISESQLRKYTTLSLAD
jgi:hypothetical protein